MIDIGLINLCLKKYLTDLKLLIITAVFFNLKIISTYKATIKSTSLNYIFINSYISTLVNHTKMK